MKCLILAGGFGRRLHPIIGDKPKALIEYRGKPLLGHLLEKIPANLNVFVTINRKFEFELNQWLRTVQRPVELLVENAWSEEQKFGALSAISYWSRTKQIEDDLLVLAADNYFEFEMHKFINMFDGKNTLVAIYDIGDETKASSFGVVQLDGEKVIQFVEKPLEPVSTQVATACYIFPHRVLKICADYCSQGKRDLLGSFIAHLVENDEVRGFSFKEKWFDIGSEIMKGQAGG